MSKVQLSTGRQSLARLNARIEALTDDRHRSWLTTYRDHWWGEVIGDVDAVMATMSRGPIHYSFDGNSFMVSAGLSAIETYEDTHRMYQGVVDLGVKMAGPLDQERIAFDETGIMIFGVLTAIYPGVFVAPRAEPVDPKGLYLLRWPNATIIRFDAAGLMMGEEILNGAPITIRPIGAEYKDSLIDGPLPPLD